MIYFDHSATTKPSEEILDLYKKISTEYWYNSETLYNEGKRSNALYLKSYETVLKEMKLVNKKVLFTSGATEANNTALYGYIANFKNKDCELITSKIEHASVLKVYQDLEKQGFKVTYLDVDDEGNVDLEQLKKTLNNKTVLLSIMWVNNIIGSIQPIKEIINILKDYPRCKFHVDCVQGYGKIKPDFDFNDLDFITLSGHKLHGIKGTGCLIYTNNINLSFMKGGHQQDSIRPGTLDLAGAVCMAKTIQNAYKNYRFDDVKEKYLYLVKKLENCPNLILIRNHSSYSPYILNINIPSLRAETALHLLNEKGIIVGTGSACNSKSKDLDPALSSILKNKLNPINSIRISLDSSNTYEELDLLIKELSSMGGTK